MSILIDENTKLLIQGVGKDGSFQALRMLDTKREKIPAKKHGNIPL